MIKKKILGKAHMRRILFVAVEISRSPIPIIIGTISERKGIIHAY
jgi:hypothetical protein